MDVGQLDGVSAILAALATAGGAGVGDGLKTIAKDTVVAARNRLFEMVRRGLRKDPLADARLTVYAAEPTPANAQTLRKHIIEAGLHQDKDLVAAARQVLEQSGPTALGPGSMAGTIITSLNTGPGHTHIGGVQHYGAVQNP